MNEDPLRRVATLLAAQDGVARTRQLEDLGLAYGVIRQRVATGEWTRFGRGVVGIASAQMTWRRELRVATLVAGERAVVSHSASARIHGLDGYGDDRRIALTGMGGDRIRSTPGIEVHRCAVLLGRHRRSLDGFNVVIMPVTLMQIGVTDGREAAAKALDGMLRDGVRPAWIRQVAHDWRRPGVAGPALVLELLHERIDAALPLSWFQRLAKRCLEQRAIQVVDEHPVLDTDGGRLATLDLAIPPLKIGIECQSWAWHGTPAARVRDAHRKRRLRLLGWELVEVWWSDLDRMDEIVAEVRMLIDRRSGQMS